MLSPARPHEDPSYLVGKGSPVDLPLRLGVNAGPSEELGLQRKDLTEYGRAYLEAIASVSCKLGLDTTSRPAVLATVTKLRETQWAAEDAQAEIENIAKVVAKQSEIIRTEFEKLERMSSSLTAQATSKTAELDGIKQKWQRQDIKAAKYVEDLGRLQCMLQQEGYHPQLEHDMLMERSERLKTKQREIEALQDKLDSFNNLPPDIHLAQQMYDKKNEQLLAATSQFEDLLNHM